MQWNKSASCFNFSGLQHLELSGVTMGNAEVCTVYDIPADWGGP